MLFDAATLRGIESGAVTCAFRTWKRPTVRAGGRLRTRVGKLAIESVEPIDPAPVTDAEAVRAGAADAAEIRSRLASRTGSDYRAYRVTFRLAGADPHVALRESLPDDEVAARLVERLERWDETSHHGSWAGRALELIADQPGTRAPDLAAQVGREIQPFKRDVRRLKELGLTESLEVGYRLSPRGRAILDHLRAGR